MSAIPRTNIISPIYKALALAALAVVILACGYLWGSHHIQAKWDAEVSATKAVNDFKTVQGSAFTTVFVTEYKDRIKTIYLKGETITKEVPVYVTAQDDLAYPVNRGFIRVLNAAVQGDATLGAAEGADRTPSGVALSTVAGVLVYDFTACHAYRERAESLIQYVQGQQAIDAAPAPH